MATRTGLVSYTGDSEISDSEDERVSTGQTPPGLSLHGLGIPTSRSLQGNTPPPPLAPTVIMSAPSTGLVAYYGEEEEDGEGQEDVFKQPIRRRSSENNQPVPQDEVPVIEVGSKEVEEETHPLYLPLSAIQLPPEPVGQCPVALQDKVVAMLRKKEELGIDLNRNIQRRKDFRNPSIYEKLVQYCGLDECGTNYPEHLYNPREWGEEGYYDNLQKAQKKAYEKKEKAKLERTKVEFVTGTKRPAAMATTQEVVKKPRKSKWDVGSSDSRGSSPAGKGVGAQAIAHASQMNRELSRLAK